LLGLGRAFGRLHVVDVSDISKPRGVAEYEPMDGGAHNVWVAGDTLYLGDYQGGLRVLDVAGEMRGDLLRQGREIAHVVTADTKGNTPNAAMTWGAIYRNGHNYVPDVFSGLWIVKVDSKVEGCRKTGSRWADGQMGGNWMIRLSACPPVRLSACPPVACPPVRLSACPPAGYLSSAMSTAQNLLVRTFADRGEGSPT
jgi:hypothetical protein